MFLNLLKYWMVYYHKTQKHSEHAKNNSEEKLLPHLRGDSYTISTVKTKAALKSVITQQSSHNPVSKLAMATFLSFLKDKSSRNTIAHS